MTHDEGPFGDRTFRDVVEFSSDSLVIVDDAGTIVLANRKAEELFGYARAELIGQTIDILVPRRYRSKHSVVHAHYLAKPNPRPMGVGLDICGLRRDGTEFPAEISLNPIDAQGRTVAVATIRDVTIARRTEHALRESEERYRLLVENASEIIYKVLTPGDPLRGDVQFVSQAAARLTGHEPDAFVRDPELWSRLIHPDDLSHVAETTRGILRNPTGGLRSYRIKKKDGTYCWVEDRVTPLIDEGGRLIGYQGVALDVTERRELEGQLLQSQKMEAVGRLAGGIAHDFNNLLSVIIGSTDLILPAVSDQNPIYADLQEVRSAARRAAALTQQFLAFSRSQILQPEVLNLNVVVENALTMLRRLIGEQIRVSLAMAPDLGVVWADPGQIEQVLLNLVINARDAMPAGGTITIETRNIVLDDDYATTHPWTSPGPYVALAVSDTGVGMDHATCLRVFEPFFTTKGPEKGTGLGLSTVYGTVKQSGGSIEVYSEPGRGTTFQIYLPQAVDTEAGRANFPLAPATTDRGTETILVVEDEIALGQVAQRILEAAGYTVLIASRGEDALSLLDRSRGPVDLLFTDIVMPGLSGQELAQQVLARYPTMRVLYASGYSEKTIEMDGLLVGRARFLGKPYSAARLKAAVRELLDGPEGRR